MQQLSFDPLRSSSGNFATYPSTDPICQSHQNTIENYESNNDSSCCINCCSRSIDNGICCTRTTSIGNNKKKII